MKRGYRLLLIVLPILALLYLALHLRAGPVTALWLSWTTRQRLEWVWLPGGTFQMGNDLSVEDLRTKIEGNFSVFFESGNERPRHLVTIRPFAILRTEVTVAQYKACVEAGRCAPTPEVERCNLNVSGKSNHPANCMTFSQAADFCRWAGARLPSEAEWEYAATGGGLDIIYPWGNKAPTCTLAVIDDGSPACLPARETRAVCSRPEGNTRQGICDMAGNVWEWVEDWYHTSFVGAPVDGSPWMAQDPEHPLHVLKGGGIQSTNDFRAAQRVYHPDGWEYRGGGVRCARDG